MTVALEAVLAQRFAADHPQDAAAIVEGLPLEDAVAFIAALSPEAAAAVLGYTDATTAARCLGELEAEQAASTVAALSLEAAGALLRRFEAADTEAVLKNLSAEIAEPIQQVLRYPEGTAGALMDPRILTAHEDLPVRDALERVRRHAAQAAYYLYIVDRNGVLGGVVSMRDLMLADPDDRLATVMKTGVVALQVTASAQAVIAHPGWLEHQVLPVVDDGGRFVGALRHKLLRRLASQAAAPGATDVASALGELYKIGLVGLLNMGVGGRPASLPPAPASGALPGSDR